MDLNIIYNKSSSEMTDLPDESVHSIITSPPYFSAKNYDKPLEFGFESYGEYLSFLTRIFSECKRVLKNGCYLIVNTSDIMVPVPKKEGKKYPIVANTIDMLMKLGLEYKEDIIWKKRPEAVSNRRGQSFMNTRNPHGYRPTLTTEHILVFRKEEDKKFYRPEKEQIDKSKIEGEYELTDVWEIEPTRSKHHPAPFPDELAEKLIRYYSFHGDTVLDPFFGTGTTGVVAQDLGRNYIGYDVSPKYIGVANARLLETFTKNDPLLNNVVSIDKQQIQPIANWLSVRTKEDLLRETQLAVQKYSSNMVDEWKQAIFSSGYSFQQSMPFIYLLLYSVVNRVEPNPDVLEKLYLSMINQTSPKTVNEIQKLYNSRLESWKRSKLPKNTKVQDELIKEIVPEIKEDWSDEYGPNAVRAKYLNWYKMLKY